MLCMIFSADILLVMQIIHNVRWINIAGTRHGKEEIRSCHYNITRKENRSELGVVAQKEERCSRNTKVAGSIPSRGQVL